MDTPNHSLGFYLPSDLPKLFNCSRTHAGRLREAGEIPPPVYDDRGRMVGFPIDETDKALKARELNYPAAARVEIVRKMAEKRNIDCSALADEFLNIH